MADVALLIANGKRPAEESEEVRESESGEREWRLMFFLCGRGAA
jgi:hypothetical protein